MLNAADCDTDDFDVRPVYYCQVAAGLKEIKQGMHQHHDPTGGEKNKHRLMVTLTATFYPTELGACEFIFDPNTRAGDSAFTHKVVLGQGAIAFFDGIINWRATHRTGKTTGANERLVVVVRAAANTSYAKSAAVFAKHTTG